MVQFWKARTGISRWAQGALAEVRERDNDVAVKGAGSGDRTK